MELYVPNDPSTSKTSDILNGNSEVQMPSISSYLSKA